jgi:hypothetical protein
MRRRLRPSSEVVKPANLAQFGGRYVAKGGTEGVSARPKLAAPGWGGAPPIPAARLAPIARPQHSVCPRACRKSV